MAFGPSNPEWAVKVQQEGLVSFIMLSSRAHVVLELLEVKGGACSRAGTNPAELLVGERGPAFADSVAAWLCSREEAVPISLWFQSQSA